MAPTLRPPTPADFPALHLGFLAAFSDYVVPMQPSAEALAALLASRGYAPELSCLAVDGERVVGFWLTGHEQGGPGDAQAYDIVTGIAPPHRRQGLAARLWGEVRRALSAEGYETCSLEVIQDNPAAVALYQGLGFSIRRSLDCWRWPQGVLAPRPGRATIREVADLPWDDVRRWWEWEPTWPGRTATVRRAGRDATLLAARQEGALVGYLALVRSAANVAQLAVAPSSRRQGVGRALLAAAAEHLPGEVALRFLNVPPDASPTASLLRRAGGEVYVRQWEMVAALGLRRHRGAADPE